MPSARSLPASAGPAPFRYWTAVSSERAARDAAACGAAVASVKHEDRVGLDRSAPRQRGDANRGARGIRLAEVLRHDLVDLGELRQVGHVDGDLGRVAER